MKGVIKGVLAEELKNSNNDKEQVLPFKWIKKR